MRRRLGRCRRNARKFRPSLTNGRTDGRCRRRRESSFPVRFDARGPRVSSDRAPDGEGSAPFPFGRTQAPVRDDGRAAARTRGGESVGDGVASRGGREAVVVADGFLPPGTRATIFNPPEVRGSFGPRLVCIPLLAILCIVF